MRLPCCLFVALAVIGVTGRSLHDRHGQLFSRDELVAKCRLSLFLTLEDPEGSGSKKRDLFHHGNETLVRRMRLPTDPDDPDIVEAYVIKETGGGPFPGKKSDESKLIHWQNRYKEGVNTADYKIFAERKTKFGMHIIGLAGCTGLLIVSKKGVYMAHYWENIAFNQDKKTPRPYPDQEQAFEGTVIRGLEQGVVGDPARGAKQEQASLRAVAPALDDEDIHAFLIIPATGQSDVGLGIPDPYRTYWSRIKNTVGEILPRLKPKTDPTDTDLWTEYPYRPVEDEEEEPGKAPWLWRSSRGRILFKYDPNHRRADGTKVKKTFVAIENEVKDEGSFEWND
ncbi:hypothetical protein B0T14DRAFT_529228 [Immersiella caudata]|uniref:Uncharacterized protein n=1 Tax=Immersiella caudata TaxID=314043 RepID=A0AA39WBV9_9PEZI|nr:hypothetical protein B0T14DRAFT_529228 [Immersiella caudata]